MIKERIYVRVAYDLEYLEGGRDRAIQECLDNMQSSGLSEIRSGEYRIRRADTPAVQVGLDFDKAIP